MSRACEVNRLPKHDICCENATLIGLGYQLLNFLDSGVLTGRDSVEPFEVVREMRGALIGQENGYGFHRRSVVDQLQRTLHSNLPHRRMRRFAVGIVRETFELPEGDVAQSGQCMRVIV